MSKLDYATVTKDQQASWATGDFSVVARAIVPAAEELVIAADPHAGERVLDAGCGSGNVALAAARRYCRVTGVDYVPSLLARARARAEAEGTPVELVEADVQALPQEDASFDCVLSTFGVMFAPDQTRTAHELCRVCRRGGTIAVASWTPDGTVGEFFRMVARFAPPLEGLDPPTRWGTETGLVELFADRATLRTARRKIVKEYFLSIDHAVDVFCTYFGPTARLASALTGHERQAFTSAMGRLFREQNRSGDATFAMPLEYLEAVLGTV